jgi:predicted Zn-dependent protease
MLAMQEGHVGAAEAEFRRALAANPADIDARRLFAEALWARGEKTAAIVQMEAASQLAPHDAHLQVRAGEMLLAAGEIPRAGACAEAAIVGNSHFGPAWALSGRAHWEAGRPDRAIADLQRSLVDAPGNKQVLLELAQMYLDRGEPSWSLTTVHQLLDLCPPGTESQAALFVEGQAYLAVGRAADAAESLLAASRRGNPRADIFCALARAEAQRGRTGAAIRAAHHALAANATHRESLQLLAELNGAVEPASGVVRR